MFLLRRRAIRKTAAMAAIAATPTPTPTPTPIFSPLDIPEPEADFACVIKGPAEDVAVDPSPLPLLPAVAPDDEESVV